MIAGNFLSQDLIPLRTSDTGQDALGMMSDFYIRHLPIVNDKQLLGLVAEDDILNHDVEEAVGSYQLSMSRPFVYENDHIFDVLRAVFQFKLTVVPVVDENDNYLGMITQHDLIAYFANTASFADPGSIIVLEMGRHDYTLAEISRIVESENAVILSSFVTSQPNSTKIEVTVKINHQDIQRVIAAFERFDYIIKASFTEAEYYDGLKDRFDSFMSYLNV